MQTTTITDNLVGAAVTEPGAAIDAAVTEPGAAIDAAIRHAGR